MGPHRELKTTRMPNATRDILSKPVVVLFRWDLRIRDNAALSKAAISGCPVVPVFVLDQASKGVRPIGSARRWWLHHSLTALSRALKALGAPLVLRQGETLAVVDDLVRRTDAGAVFWNRRYDPAESKVDSELKAHLRERGVEARSFEGQLLHEPSRLQTKAGGPFKVYSPFWRALASLPEPRDPIDPPASLARFDGEIPSDDLADYGLTPTAPDWAAGFFEDWTPGEDGAMKRLHDFLDEGLRGYAEQRDRPDIEGTSRLSPHLASGEITPFQIFHALRTHRSARNGGRDAEKFRMEIGWREFSYHLLFHNPDLRRTNFNDAFDDFPWKPARAATAAWRRGKTGYPIVDAGMRQLWSTGWMHNRVRMIVASFLIKHLLTDWRSGEDWFWDTLVDADPANNAASWQWVAGSGADAAPYFRVFNPILQGEKFDPDGAYVRRWVPELRKLPDRWLHQPWSAPADTLRDAGVKLGTDYPVPVVDHDTARDRALTAYREMREPA